MHDSHEHHPRIADTRVVGVQMKRGSETRDVHQFAYEAWPDHGVPLTTREFLTFRAAIKVRA